MDYEWKLLKKEKCFSSKWINISKNKVAMSTGIVVDDYYVVETFDSVMILALDANDNIILKKEYRLPVEEVLYELPAGGFEKGESDPLEVAKRELLEETGYVSEDWLLISQSCDCPNRFNNKLYLFIAQNVHKETNQCLDLTEYLEYILVPLDEAVEMCMKNLIRVNSSVHLILKASIIKERNKGMICI